MTGETIERLKGAKDVKELMAFVDKEGIKLSLDSASKLFERIHTAGEISDDELDCVSGGACYSEDGGYLMTTAGYSCGHYQDNPHRSLGVRGTCFRCVFWDMDSNIERTLFTCVGVPLKCLNSENRRVLYYNK